MLLRQDALDVGPDVDAAATEPEPEQRELILQMESRVVHLHPGLTPLRARQLNLDATTRALDAAGIDYFAVRGMNDCGSVLGVRAQDRDLVHRAIGRLFQETTGYVQVVLPIAGARRGLMRGDRRATWQSVAEATVIRLVWFRAEPTGQLVYTEGYGCEIEFWRRDDERDRLVAPRANRMMRTVPARDSTVLVPGDRFTYLAPVSRSVLPPVRTRRDFTPTLPDEIRFPIDVVYTWVDGSDPVWIRRRQAAQGLVHHEEAASAARFISRDELRYSLRSVHLFMPWVRNIYLVTDDQVPRWLNPDVENLRVVSHREIFSDPEVLPTYNSFAIESQLHHIDGLAEHFLYFNDDMFIGRPVPPQRFFLGNGLSKYFLSQTRVPLGPISDQDTPIDATVKNNRALIEKRFGLTVTQCNQHVPYPLRRGVLAELEETYPREFRATMTSRFRGPDNLSVTYSLHHYFGYCTGRAVPGSVRYGYLQLAIPDLAQRLARLLVRRDWDTFCLNDAFSTEAEVEAQNAILKPFLEAYFPVPSPYERQDPDHD